MTVFSTKKPFRSSPFAVVESELAPVRVAPVNMNDAARCRSGWRPAAVLELYPCDSGQLRGDKQAFDQLNVAGIVLNDGRAYSCALQSNSLGYCNPS